MDDLNDFSGLITISIESFPNLIILDSHSYLEDKGK